MEPSNQLQLFKQPVDSESTSTCFNLGDIRIDATECIQNNTVVISSVEAIKRGVLGKSYIEYKVERKRKIQNIPKQERQVKYRCKHKDIEKRMHLYIFVCSIYR